MEFHRFHEVHGIQNNDGDGKDVKQDVFLRDRFGSYLGLIFSRFFERCWKKFGHFGISRDACDSTAHEKQPLERIF